MPITDPDLKITLRYTFQGQQCENVQWYETDGAAFLTATAEGVGQAWWNDVKTVWRAAIVSSSNFVFNSVLVSEGDPLGAFGEFAIPTGESAGTRPAGSLGNYLPSFNAVGVRLSISSRVTRPGQKRFPGVTEGDNDNGELAPAYITIIDALADKYDSAITLGAPVATGVLHPEVVRLAGVPAVVTARQRIVGHVTNPRVTSQVSRRFGNGR